MIRRGVALLVFVVLTAIGCRGGDGSGSAERTVGPATLRVPTAWRTRVEPGEADRQVWSPQANDGKETLALRIAVRRTRMSDDEIFEAASTAQGLLRGVTVIERRGLITPSGMRAVWLETAFQPKGDATTYRRAHVTAIGKTHVFHLFYTAATPDAGLRVLHEAVNSLKEQG